MVIIAQIIPFKTKHQLKTDKAVKVMREWEQYLECEYANLYEVEGSEEYQLSEDEIDWLNSWVNETELVKDIE